MAQLGDLLSNIEMERYLRIQKSVRDLYEALSGNEAKVGTDGVIYASHVLEDLPKWIDLLNKEVFIAEWDEYGAYLTLVGK